MRSCPFSVHSEDEALGSPGLGEVVAEGSEHHVVDGLGTLAHTRNTGRGAGVVTGPADLLEVGVLNTPTQAALRALVDVVPETESALDDLVNVSGASATAGRSRRRGIGGGR